MTSHPSTMTQSSPAHSTACPETPRWYGGRLLAFSALDGQTDYQHGLVLTTLFDRPGLEIKLPAQGRIEFALAPEQATMESDHWTVSGEGQVVRGAFVDAWHVLVEGPIHIASLDPALSQLAHEGRLLIGVAEHFDPDLVALDLGAIIASRSTWQATQAHRLAGHAPARQRVLARAMSLMKGHLCSPEGTMQHRWTTPDRWPHRGMWLWDTAFHAIGWRHLDPALAREMIDAMFDAQAEDGFLPHMIMPDRQSDITQPPVLALAVSLVLETAPDTAWLADIYPKLAAYVRWDLASRDRDADGLLEWFIEDDPRCRSGESGMDNSNRFDDAILLGATDFNSYLAHECELLAAFATTLGKTEDATNWQAEAARIQALIREKLYSESDGFFLDYNATLDAPSKLLASAGFMPLLCGAADHSQLDALLLHLDNPDTFGTPVPLPSVARSTQGFSTDMWRGPMWVCVNWLVARGLDRYGETARATDLRRRTVAEIETQFDHYGVFFEYYDSLGETPPPQLMRKGKCPPVGSVNPYPHQVIHDFGWSYTLYVDMVLSACL